MILCKNFSHIPQLEILVPLQLCSCSGRLKPGSEVPYLPQKAMLTLVLENRRGFISKEEKFLDHIYAA